MLRQPEGTYAAMRASSPDSVREDLVQLGLPIVRRMAFRMARRLPSHIDVNDLIGAGTEGLLRAVAAFAVGGKTALADQRTDSARKLLGQMK